MTNLAAIHKCLFAIALLLVPMPNTLAQQGSSSPSSASSPETTESATNIISPSTGINYSLLRNLLAAEQWRQANDETRRLMLKAAKREQQGWLTVQDIENLPCWDLQTMNNLWKQYSGGRFGFSIQYPIFVNTGNRPGRLMAPDAYDRFGTQVGWRQNNEWILFKQGLNFSLDAPIGHLPNPRDEYQINGGRLEYTNLMKRISDCKMVANPASVKPAPSSVNKPKTNTLPSGMAPKK
ncbi:MAG: GUN4 domain-containing protein [Snowella sp.]|nr:GUN4 domain-containing protein [Snowella sp.]